MSQTAHPRGFAIQWERRKLVIDQRAHPEPGQGAQACVHPDRNSEKPFVENDQWRWGLDVPLRKVETREIHAFKPSRVDFPGSQQQPEDPQLRHRTF